MGNAEFVDPSGVDDASQPPFRPQPSLRLIHADDPPEPSVAQLIAALPMRSAEASLLLLDKLAVAEEKVPPGGMIEAVLAAQRLESYAKAQQIRWLAAFARPGVAVPVSEVLDAVMSASSISSDDRAQAPDGLPSEDDLSDCDRAYSQCSVYGDPDWDAEVALQAARFAEPEITAAMMVAPITARRRIDKALELVDELPGTFAALEAGDIDGVRAVVIAEAVVGLDPELKREVERAVLPTASGVSPGELGRRALAAAVDLDPDAARVRAEAARLRRGVGVRGLRDDLARFHADLDADSALLAFGVIDHLAAQVSDESRAGRGVNQVRADVFADLFHGLAENGRVDVRGFTSNDAQDKSVNGPANSDQTGHQPDVAEPDHAEDNSRNENRAERDDNVSTDAADEAAESEPLARTDGVDEAAPADGSDDVDETEPGVGAGPVDEAAPADGSDDLDESELGDCAGPVDEAAPADGSDDVDESELGDCAGPVDGLVPEDHSHRVGEPESREPNGLTRSDVGRPPDRSGLRPTHPNSSAIGVNLDVTVALSTLLGMDDLSGQLAGHGVITADLARSLASAARSVRLIAIRSACAGSSGNLLTSDQQNRPQSGRLLRWYPPEVPVLPSLSVESDSERCHPGCSGGPECDTDIDYGRRVYRPPAALADKVRTRDQRCRFPGCGTPAQRCDLDHRNPYHWDRESSEPEGSDRDGSDYGASNPGESNRGAPNGARDHTVSGTGASDGNRSTGGVTCACNLDCLCRFHHRAKTFTNWSAIRMGNTLQWTSPLGRDYIDHPSDLTIGRSFTAVDLAQDRNAAPF